MLKRIGILIEGNESFSIETTLSTRSYAKLVERAHRNGFNVQLLFFWLPFPELAIQRVAQRVIEGGHNIPEDVIVRRYHAGINNLFNIYMNIVGSSGFQVGRTVFSNDYFFLSRISELVNFFYPANLEFNPRLELVKPTGSVC